MDDAIVVLDDGNRSERSKRGKFAFEAVQSGEHSVTLLTDSLPEGAIISGATTQEATLGRDRMAIELRFLVSVTRRAEVRKVFGGKEPVAPRPASRRPAARRRRAKTRTPEAACDDRRRAPATIVSARRRSGIHSADRRVRRPAAGQEDGRRADGDGICGATRRADSQQPERPVSRARRRIRDARRGRARFDRSRRRRSVRSRGSRENRRERSARSGDLQEKRERNVVAAWLSAQLKRDAAAAHSAARPAPGN